MHKLNEVKPVNLGIKDRPNNIIEFTLRIGSTFSQKQQSRGERSIRLLYFNIFPLVFVRIRSSMNRMMFWKRIQIQWKRVHHKELSEHIHFISEYRKAWSSKYNYGNSTKDKKRKVNLRKVKVQLMPSRKLWH